MVNATYEDLETPWFVRFRIWIIIAVFTVLWHIAIFYVPWTQLVNPGSLALPPKVELTRVSDTQLEKIRNQWKEKKFLLSKNQPATENGPDNARYQSDKARRVERETRARETQVIPQQNTLAPPASGEATNSKDITKPFDRLPPLNELGIPFRLNERPRPQDARAANPDPYLNPGAINGGDQAINERELPFGAENMLNTDQSTYYSYYSRLYQAIGPVWQSKIRSLSVQLQVPAGEYITRVDVVFDSQGNIVDIFFINYSGVQEFDRVVEDAWQRIGKFPNPPNALLNASGQVHTGWTFTVSVGQDSLFRYGTPKREY